MNNKVFDNFIDKLDFDGCFLLQLGYTDLEMLG